MKKKLVNASKRIISALASATLVFSASVTNTRINIPSVNAAAKYTITFPVNNGNKIAYYFGYSSQYLKDEYHTGIDIHDKKNDDTIYAAASGTIDDTANSCGHYGWYKDHGKKDCGHYKTFGNYIRIKGDDGLYYYYGHLAKNTIKVNKGDKVIAGQALAKMGASGAATGKHLHFEVRKTTSSSSKLNTNPASVSGHPTGLFNYNDGPYNTKQITVKFYRNLDIKDTYTVSESFVTGTPNNRFGYKSDGSGRYNPMNDGNKGFGQWTKDGYELLGWSDNRNATEAKYKTYSGVTDNWISSNKSVVNLYAVWKEIKSVPLPSPSSSSPVSSESPSLLPSSGISASPGDINLDGKIDIMDLTILSMNLIGDRELNSNELVAADTDCDGTVDLADLANLKCFLSKIQTSLNPSAESVSEWISASEVSDNAEIIEEKWIYDITEEEKAVSESPEMAGWTPTGSQWVSSEIKTNSYVQFPEGFDTSSEIYKKYNSSAFKSYTTETEKREVSEPNISSYIMWHWNYELKTPCAPDNRFISESKGNQNINGTSYNFTHFSAFEISDNITETDKAGEVFKFDTDSREDVSWWWYKLSVMTQKYTDSKLMYTFSRTVVKETGLESSHDPSGITNVTNIKKIVKVAK